MEDSVLKLTVQLYKNISFSRKDVQFVVDIFSDFIKNEYNPLLKNELQNNLNGAIEYEAVVEIDKIFHKYENPFEDFKTEDKRIRLYKKINLYVEPTTVSISKKFVTKVNADKLELSSESVSMIHVSVIESLKRILEIDGLFHATETYLAYLYKQKDVLENIVQGETWQDMLKNFDKSDGLIWPINIFFDDVEIGNALGAHSGDKEIGAVYGTIPCFPPKFSSKLKSIFITDLFYTQDRKKYGNKAVFKTLIEELRILRNEGIDITIQNKNQKIYFLTCQILSDNLGLNGILGFSESFANTVCCRVCYATPEQIKSMVIEAPDLLRTEEKYKEDVNEINFQETGIKGECCFDEIEDYNPITNQTSDCMHDFLEGVLNYVMALIILHLVTVDNCFSIETLNILIKSFDYHFDSVNKPPAIDLEYLKKNNRLKMSAAEMLTFGRYFGLIAGHLIPSDNIYYQVYKLLRKILDIIMSPIMTPADVFELQETILNHHKLYKDVFNETLKHKFHALIHYVRLILKVGPLVKVWVMRHESYHRIPKKIAMQAHSKKHIPLTIAIRQQLSLMYCKYDTYFATEVEYGPSNNNDKSWHNYFIEIENKESVKYAIVNSIKYSPGSIIIIDMNQYGPVFGVQSVYKINNKEVYFKYKIIQTIGFDSHYYAYVTVISIKEDVISYKKLISYASCLPFIKEKFLYIVPSHSL